MPKGVIAVFAVLLCFCVAGCLSPVQNHGGCAYEGTSISLSGNLTYIMAGRDLPHEANLTNTHYEISVRAGTVVLGGDLLLSSTVPDHATGGKRLIYEVKYKGTTGGSSDELVLAPGSSANLSIQIFVENATDPYILDKKFFDGKNEITGNITMSSTRQRTNITLDKEYSGVTIYPNNWDIRKTIMVRTPDWSFDVVLFDGILCKE